MFKQLFEKGINFHWRAGVVGAGGGACNHQKTNAAANFKLVTDFCINFYLSSSSFLRR